MSDGFPEMSADFAVAVGEWIDPDLFREIETSLVVSEQGARMMTGAVKRVIQILNDDASDDGSLSEGNRLEVVSILEVAVKRYASDG